MNSQLLTDRIYKLETKDRKPELQYSNFEIHLATSAAEMVAYLSGIGDDCFSPFLDAAFELLRIQMLEGFHSGINRNLLEGKTAIKAPSLCILEGFRLAYGVVFHLMKLRALYFILLLRRISVFIGNIFYLYQCVSKQILLTLIFQHILRPQLLY